MRLELKLLMQKSVQNVLDEKKESFEMTFELSFCCGSVSGLVANLCRTDGQLFFVFFVFSGVEKAFVILIANYRERTGFYESQ